MSITTRDQLISALGNNSSQVVIDKASISNTAANQFHSLWRATGQPGQGAIPSTAAACTHATTGAVLFTQQTSPATTYAAYMYGTCSNAATTIEMHDRLAHMGGLSGTVITAQTVGIDFSSLSGSNDIAARMGDSDYSDIQWWVEWYTDTGSTGVNITAAVTYDDASTGNLTAVALGATRRASFMVPLNGSIPSASAGRSIRAINTVTLSATTGTAGSFGVTATRLRATMPLLQANFAQTFDWAALGLPNIVNSSCLFFVALCSTTTTGTVRGGGKLIHG